MKRLIWLVVVAAALFFALQGGEYSTRDLYVLHVHTRTLTHEVDSLRREVDSLGRFLHAVKTDPITQERIAREEFGMVRGDKEILYRFGEAPDTTSATAR
jgi:cell division protein FtsB